MKEYRLHDGKKGAALAVRVIPRAAQNEIVEVLNDGTIKIRLKSSSDNSEINQILVQFLNQVLRVGEKNIEIVAGVNARSKLVSVLELDSITCQQRILGYIS